MSRRTFELRVAVESDDAEPELVAHLDEGALSVRLSGGRVVEVDAYLVPTEREREAALDVVVALLPEAQVNEVLGYLYEVRPGKESVVRGTWVRRVDAAASQTGSTAFHVHTRGFYGPALAARDAAALVLREEQRRKVGAR